MQRSWREKSNQDDILNKKNSLQKMRRTTNRLQYKEE